MTKTKELTQTLPPLFHKGKGGAIYQWTVATEGNCIVTIHGQVGGASQTSRKEALAKNVGRSNATTPEQQALVEAKAMWNHRLERKYAHSPAEACEEMFFPMLAQDFSKHGHKVVFPADVQPKLDGFRCLAKKEDGRVSLYSRAGKVFNLSHIQKQLETILPDNSIVDGELYVHGVSLQVIGSWIKKQRPETARIEYHIYDVPVYGNSDEDLPWAIRRVSLQRIRNVISNTLGISHITTVKTVEVRTEDEVMSQQALAIGEGYEGAMVRTLDGLYQFNYRSYDLLKVKSFQDAEFHVVDCKGGRGKFNDQAVFTCVTAAGKMFEVVPRGTTAERQAYLANAKKYIGQRLTVKYFKLTDGGVPFLPVGLHFREDFD